MAFGMERGKKDGAQLKYENSSGFTENGKKKKVDFKGLLRMNGIYGDTQASKNDVML